MKFVLTWKWEMLSPLAGAFLALAFAPFGFWFLGVASLFFAMFTWQNVSPKQAALRGFLYGVGMFGLGVSWVYVSIHDYGGAHFIGAGLLTVFFCLFWALFPALTAYLVAKYGKGESVWLNAILLPAIWILIEYFRGNLLLNGFPWLQVAYTQLDTPLAGYIPIVGGYGAGFLLLVSIQLIVEAMKQKSFSWKFSFVLLLIWVCGAALKMVNWTEVVGDPIKVTLIQGNVAQDKKWLPEYRIKTLIDYRDLTDAHWDSDVIIWPETAIPAFFHQVDEFFIRPLEFKAKQQHTDLIVSLPGKGNEANENYNMILTLGEVRGVYKKNHLLPFGEYLPLQPLSGMVLEWLGINLGNFVPGGNDQTLMKAGGYPFAASICYEDAFASAFIPALPEAAYLVNVTNDAWFGDSLEPYQHMQIARMRALETGRFLLRTTNTGVTGIIDSKGSLIQQAQLFQQTTVTGDINPMSGMTPYARIGDKVVIMGILLMSALGTFSFRVNYDDRV